MLKVHVTPNLAMIKKAKNIGESSLPRPQTRIRIPPAVEIKNEIIRLGLTPIL